MAVGLLVIDGGGYIGTHMVKLLARQGHQVTVFDNLSTGHRDAVSGADFVEGDLRRRSDAARAFEGWWIDVVRHFAARCDAQFYQRAERRRNIEESANRPRRMP